MSQIEVTQTPTCTTLEETSQFLTPKIPWGKLIPILLGLKPYELFQNTFTFGRSADNDICATEHVFPKNTIKSISKQQFIITKETEHLVIIQDISRNGTWINGKLIGNKKRVILQDGDEICVGIKNLRIYLFKHFNQQKCTYLPSELQKVYEVSKTLGKGAFGEVKLAFSKRGCHPCAIKKLPKGNISSDESSYYKIHNEIKILRTLSHPCIVTMQNFFECDDAFYIVLELMEGGTLQERIQTRRNIPETEVKLIFYQIALAVNYLHNHEITHRDLKPANVLLSSHDRETVAKVSDFGLSKITDNDTLLLTACGTLLFLAPEVLLCKKLHKPYTKKVDIWSSGVILYYMITKELPFRPEVEGNLHQLCKLIINGKYSMENSKWDAVSDNAKNLLQKMLTVEPKNRISVCEILKHLWLDNDDGMKSKVKSMIEDGGLELEDSFEQPLKRSRLSIVVQ